MSERSLYETVLTQMTGEERVQARPPRPSASVVLWRRSEAGEIEVFWVKRSEELAFMGGWHAFPGGLSRNDLQVPVQGTPRGLEAPPAFTAPEPTIPAGSPPEPDFVPGLLACIVRELFEETGLLLVQELLPGACSGPVVAAGQLETARQELLAKDATFDDVVTALELTPDASPLVFAGRWLTPPFAPVRFDNRFFFLEWPQRAAFQPAVVEGELESGEWILPSQALEAWRQGQVLTAPPILHLLKVLADDGPERGLERARRTEEVNLGPLRRIEFRPGVVMLPLGTATLPPASHTNTYLLGPGDAVVVDPGSPFPEEQERLASALDALMAQGHRIHAIWLTHHHPDHVGGVEALRRHLEVPVLAHPLTARHLSGRGIEVDGFLADGQEVEIPGDPPMTVRVIHTPGHARGHLCFLDTAGGSLLAGDMVAGIGTIVIDPPEGDMDDYLASLEKLVEAAPKTLFPSHGPAVKNGVARLEEYIRHRLWREERILEAWGQGLHRPAQILPAAYDDVPEVALPLAERQLEAHLARLRRLGRLDR
jgi:glyoxylase-like metal-dependent hydrolase (beta-lactamase superfamily II)/8-oxo-dGTP pyrophosphatase MutT (NUDIX family)